MGEQEKLIKEIKSLSDSIRRKNRALRLGISERDKYLETTFKPVVEPLKELSQTVKKFTLPTETDLMLPLSKFEKKENSDDLTESPEIPEDTDVSETASDVGKQDVSRESTETKYNQEEEENEDQPVNPSNISKLGKDMTSIGTLGRKYLLRMLHSTASNRKYHVYGARLEGDGLKIGNTNLTVDKNDNILIGERKYKGTLGLFELIFKSKPERYTRLDLSRFKQICQLTNAHKKLYTANGPIHKNTSVKYKSIIAGLFPSKRVQMKRRAMSAAELNVLHKKRKTTLGEGLLKDAYSTNVIYYNNVNKLVTRMRLLHEAMEAGHTGLENEWVALTVELRNRGVIE